MTYPITVTLVHSALKRITNVHRLRMAISSLVFLLHIPFSPLDSLLLFVSERRNVTSIILTWGNSSNLCLMATAVAPMWQLKAALTVYRVKFTRQLMLIHHVLWFVPHSHIYFVVLRNLTVINCCFVCFSNPEAKHEILILWVLTLSRVPHHVYSKSEHSYNFTLHSMNFLQHNCATAKSNRICYWCFAALLSSFMDS